MADLFLSYARPSVEAAKRVAAGLRACGYSVWFDENLPAHRAYSEVIEEQLETASAVLVLWSADAVRSQWVRSEANRARETGRLVQARLDDARLPMPFDQIQCADLRGWRGQSQSPGWQSIVASIAALMGYPSVADDRDLPASPSSAVKRRQLLLAAGAATVSVGAIGWVGWRSLERPVMSPRAELLLERGLAALQDNDALDPQGVGSTMQAIALLSDATEAAPDSATAWGALAMAYAVRKRVAPRSDRAGLAIRSRAAADKALEIDPSEVRALAALLLIKPFYRNWLAAEREARAALEKNPRLPILIFILSDVLGSVGRWKDAAALSARFDRSNFLIPGADRKVVVNLWASGDIQGADSALEAAVEHWPQHPQIWRTRIAYLMYSGRPAEALELLRQDAERPVDVTPHYLTAARAVAEGLVGQRPASSALARALGYLHNNPGSALQIAQASAALGDAGTAFDILDGYYFGEGRWSAVAPPAGDEDRVTIPLFQPPMRSLWRVPQFDALLTRIGLNAYWRESGTVPDFRRDA